MADIQVDGRMKVGSLRKQFKDAFGATLRVYIGRSNRPANDEDSLASIRAEGAPKTGDLAIRGNMLVGNFEERFEETFGIKIQVANADNTKLSDNSLSLSNAGK